MALPSRKRSKRFSEFFIPNHPLIFLFIMVCICCGVFFESTSGICFMFLPIYFQYQMKSEKNSKGYFESGYERGRLDIFNVLFIVMSMILLHAVIKDIIEKGAKRIFNTARASRTKKSKFLECGQLAVWCVVFTIWGFFQIQQDDLHKIPLLWDGYPHTTMKWSTKLFLICQIGYWLHMYLELYLQKVKKEEVASRLRDYSLHFFFITGAYVFHFWRICILLLSLHYLVEAILHWSRLLRFSNKIEVSNYGFFVWKWLYLFVHFVSLTFSILMFWFGLGSLKNQEVNFATGNYNSFFIRLTCTVSMFVLQGWLMLPYFTRILQEKAEKKIPDITPETPSLKQKSPEISTGNPARAVNKLKKN